MRDNSSLFNKFFYEEQCTHHGLHYLSHTCAAFGAFDPGFLRYFFLLGSWDTIKLIFASPAISLATYSSWSVQAVEVRAPTRGWPLVDKTDSIACPGVSPSFHNHTSNSLPHACLFETHHRLKMNNKKVMIILLHILQLSKFFCPLLGTKNQKSLLIAPGPIQTQITLYKFS